MRWYGGSIAEAVTLSKQRNAIFVVFVEGDNDLSREMSSTIDDSAVVSLLSNETNFLTIKLKSGTVDYTHFAQIYQFVPVPSLFFIGHNGTPLEVVCAGVHADNLAQRIDRILSEHRKEKPAIHPSTSSQNIRNETANLIRAEGSNVPSEAPKKAVTIEVPTEVPNSEQPKENQETSEPSPPKISKPSPEHEVVCDGDVCVRRPKADEPSTSHNVVHSPDVEQKNVQEASTSSSSIEEKMDHAKALIDAKRREKAEKDKEAEKEKELERRNTGQGVAELKRWQAEQELKQIQEERKREKLENNLARQRILEQIAQDRAERKAREAPVVAAAPATAPVTHAPLTTGDASTEARVQFKLPDGSSHTTHFPADHTLGHVQSYVTDHLHLSMSSFSIWTAFPRRELIESEATLRDLQLAPSAALLILPRRQASSQPQSTHFTSIYAFISQLITTIIYTPSLQLYSWVSSLLFPPRAVTRGGGTTTGGTNTGGTTGGIPRGATGGNATRGTAPGGVPRPPSPPAVRRRNNVHSLPGDGNNDDDNNTWNGNSTQQM